MDNKQKKQQLIEVKTCITAAISQIFIEDSAMLPNMASIKDTSRKLTDAYYPNESQEHSPILTLDEYSAAILKGTFMLHLRMLLNTLKTNQENRKYWENCTTNFGVMHIISREASRKKLKLGMNFLLNLTDKDNQKIKDCSIAAIHQWVLEDGWATTNSNFHKELSKKNLRSKPNIRDDRTIDEYSDLILLETFRYQIKLLNENTRTWINNDEWVAATVFFGSCYVISRAIFQRTKS